MIVRRGVLIGAVVAVLLLCAAGAWAARGLAVAPFVLPDAADVTVAWQRDGALRVAYRAAGAPFAWREDLTARLKAAGWIWHSYTNMGANRPPFATIWFAREVWLGPFGLEERAILGNNADNPHAASVEVYRELRFGR